jgi:hypothetical protein
VGQVNVDYWLLETEDEIKDFKFNSIASPVAMAKAIKRLQDVLDEIDGNPDHAEIVKDGLSSIFTWAVREILDGKHE